MHIRTAKSSDLDGIREVHLDAFPEGEKEIVSKLAINLLSERTTPQTISLVAEIKGVVVGHVAYSPVTIDSNEKLFSYILAPLGVRPDYQKQRIGSMLIESGIQKLSKMRAYILFVYGDPNYYSRFGFTTDNAERYIPPYKLQYPFGWQANILNDFYIESAHKKIVCVPSLCNPELW